MEQDNTEAWKRILEEGDEFKRLRWLFRMLPRNPRCELCLAPFAGPGGAIGSTRIDARIRSASSSTGGTRGE